MTGLGDPRRERLAAVVLAHRSRSRGRSRRGSGEAGRIDLAKAARWEEHRQRLARRLAAGPLEVADGRRIRRHEPRRDVLRVEGLSIHFGGIHALSEVSLTAPTGAVTGVIGPNGAGKTTLFNCLGGLLTPHAGTVVFEGRLLKGTPRRRARGGLGRTFQTPRLFRSLSVADNLVLGCAVADAARRSYRFDTRLHSLPPRERAGRIAELVGYRGSLDVPADSLSFGDLRVVELARALCAAPTLLLLDEPASGLDVDQARTLVALLRALAGLGVGVLLIEHDMSVVMEVCEEITVLDFGTVIARGSPEEIQSDTQVIDAYLGTAHHA